MPGDISDKEIELYKRLAIQEIVDRAETILKGRFALLSSLAVLISAAGTGTVVYQIMSTAIIEKQNSAIASIQLADKQREHLTDQLTSMMHDLEAAKLDQTKMLALVEDNRKLLSDSKDQFEQSSSQYKQFVDSSAKSLDDLLTAINTEASVMTGIANNPRIKVLVDPDSKVQNDLAALSPALSNGRNAVKVQRDIAANGQYVVYLHLSKSSAKWSDVETPIREWLAGKGYTVGGIDHDGTGGARIDYFRLEDRDAAEAIATHIRETYPQPYSTFQLIDDTKVPNKPGRLGLWL